MKKLLLAAALLIPFGASAQQIQGFPAAAPGVPGLQPLAHPGYMVGNWYSPLPGYLVASSGWTNPGTGEAVCVFGYIPQQFTINDLAFWIITTDAGGNVQFAIYNNGSWGRPSTLVASTSSVSTTSAGVQGAAISAQIGPGGYWFCDNFDNATAAVVTYNNTQGNAQAVLGSTSASNVINATTATAAVKIAQAFGTWPTFTNSTSWVDATTVIAPDIIFKIASVP